MEIHFPLDQIMQRYYMPVDRNLLYSYEELQRTNIDQQFIYVLLRTFEDEKHFQKMNIKNFRLK